MYFMIKRRLGGLNQNFDIRLDRCIQHSLISQNNIPLGYIISWICWSTDFLILTTPDWNGTTQLKWNDPQQITRLWKENKFVWARSVWTRQTLLEYSSLSVQNVGQGKRASKSCFKLKSVVQILKKSATRMQICKSSSYAIHSSPINSTRIYKKSIKTS